MTVHTLDLQCLEWEKQNCQIHFFLDTFLLIHDKPPGAAAEGLLTDNSEKSVSEHFHEAFQVLLLSISAQS